MRFFIALVTLFYLYAGYLYQTVESRKNLARATASESMQHFEMLLEAMIEKTNMMESYIHYRGDDQMRLMQQDKDGNRFFNDFNMLTSMLYDSGAIKSFEILPNGIVSFCYPYEGNEDLIGVDILKDSRSKEGAESSIRSGLLNIDGPVELFQGGTGLVVRNPVFFDDGTFWGFTAVAVSLPDVIEPFGLNDLARKGYKFVFKMESDAQDVVIADNLEDEDLDNAVEVSKMIAGRKSTMLIAPESNWWMLSKAKYPVLFFVVLSFFIAYLLTRNKAASLRIVEALENEKNLRQLTAQAYREAEQANMAKSDFLSAMSHDLRTPMNAIVGLCILLEREHANPQKVLDYVHKLKGSSQHLLGLINDILDMSKIESGKVSLNVREFSIATLIENINTIVRPQARTRGQVFDITAESIEHEFLIADDLRLNQILLNLLSNAVKYTPNGGHVGIKVTELKMRSPAIASFCFEVYDNGRGMSEDFLEHVFDPFVRAKDVQASSIQGTGLGMAITNNLIKLMGGTVEIKSKLGQGTHVTVRLPMKIRNDTMHDCVFFQKKGIHNVLLIDDDPDAPLTVSAILDEAAVKVKHAFNGDEAFEVLEESRRTHDDIQLILLDLKLDGQSGLDVAKRLKASEFNNIHVMLLTAYDYDDIEMDAIEDGVSAFLRKPLFLSNLKPAIESVWDSNSIESKDDDGLKIFNGMRILAAEDNELNSEILKEILSFHGATCDICANGQLIADKFETTNPGDYDLILMDVQMPILNGLEATRLIRASSRPHAKTIPIVAMTANAFSDDIKASIDAGMNFHISKPIDLKVLVDTIRQLDIQPKARSTDAAIAVVAATAFADATVVEAATADVIAAATAVSATAAATAMAAASDITDIVSDSDTGYTSSLAVAQAAPTAQSAATEATMTALSSATESTMTAQSSATEQR